MKKNIPFGFVLDNLFPLNPKVKPMFGCFAVYTGEKIVFVLRKRSGHTDDNGVWLATNASHHESLKKIFPSMRSIGIFGGDSGWQVLWEGSDDFEESVNKACEMVLAGDARIGHIPKSKKKKSKKKNEVSA